MSKYRNSINNRSDEKKNGSSFFNGKTEMNMSQIADQNPDGVHVTGIHIGEGAYGEYVAFTCREEPSSYVFGGTVFKEIVKKWLELETETEINNNLSAEPCLVIFIEKKNQKGKSYYDVI